MKKVSTEACELARTWVELRRVESMLREQAKAIDERVRQIHKQRNEIGMKLARFVPTGGFTTFPNGLTVRQDSYSGVEAVHVTEIVGAPQ